MTELLLDDRHIVHAVAVTDELPPLEDLSWVGVVIANMHMVGEPGIAFADRSHARYPDCPILLLTAYRTPTLEAQEAVRSSYLRLLDKPLDYERLHDSVHWLTS